MRGWLELREGLTELCEAANSTSVYSPTNASGSEIAQYGGVNRRK
jgi:hypothetical protein